MNCKEWINNFQATEMFYLLGDDSKLTSRIKEKEVYLIWNAALKSVEQPDNGSVASGQGSTNSAITQLPPECGKCIHKRVCPAWVLSLNNAMDVSINRCLYFEAATAQ